MSIKSFLDINREISCSIYIGQKAGKELKEHIQNAKKSIKILSPYLSASTVSWLINMKQSQDNINIELITSDKIEDYQDNQNKYKLIKQNKVYIESAKEKMEKYEDVAKILCYVFWSLVILVLGFYYLIQNNKILLGFIGVVLIYFIQKLYINKMKELKIYDYSYKQTFPFRVFTSKQTTGRDDDYLIHSKIYIIDDETIFLGSSNFTESGMQYNIETMIKTQDEEALLKIKSFFTFLLNKDGSSKL